MRYLRGPDRSEVQLLPACLDDYVAANSAVRFVEAYVEGLDLRALGFARAVAADTGRPPYHPADLLKLYCYGYLNRIRSSRRLEAEAGRNLELIWLLRGLRPDFKTIADFRRDNRHAFKGLFKEFNLLCRRLGLFGAELVAIDGSKFKALNNVGRHYTAEQLRELVHTIESRIEHYLSQLDRQDREAEGVAAGPDRAGLAQKLAQLRECKGHYDQLLSPLQGQRQREVSLSDPDSRKMKGPQGYVVGYNVQVAVDSQHGLIVAQEVVQSASDRGQLAGMALAAQEQLQAKALAAVADKGYHEADQLAACAAAGIEAFVPEPGTTSGRGKAGVPIFSKSAFCYDAEADVYVCPAGQRLARGALARSRGKARLLYYHKAHCAHCGLKRQCTSGSYRVIARRLNEAVVEATARRVQAHPEKVARRKGLVERVFGTLRLWGHDRFLLRGLERVRAEFSLSALAYNLRRVLNLVSVRQLLAALGAGLRAAGA